MMTVDSRVTFRFASLFGYTFDATLPTPQLNMIYHDPSCAVHLTNHPNDDAV